MPTIRDEPAEVLSRAGTPVQFLLRDRLYLVRSVLAHWVEPGRRRRPAPPQPAERAACAPPPADLSGVAVLGDAPQASTAELWRVEAAPGRSGHLNVFDLCCTSAHTRWTVSRVEG